MLDSSVLDDGTPFLVMERLEGETLEQLMERDGPMAASDAAALLIEALEGVAEAHAVGVVHRDLKPANIFLARRKDGSTCVKVIDFGISKVPRPRSSPTLGLTATQALMGSPLYMSPEQLRSAKAVDARTDIWALGVTLYELTTGHPPFDGDSLPRLSLQVALEAPVRPRARKSDMPRELERVILKCLEKLPEARYSSAYELARDLAIFAGARARTSLRRIRQIERTRLARVPSQLGLPAFVGGAAGLAFSALVALLCTRNDARIATADAAPRAQVHATATATTWQAHTPRELLRATGWSVARGHEPTAIDAAPPATAPSARVRKTSAR